MTYYAMSYEASSIEGKIVLLPNHIVAGSIINGEMYDYYNNTYYLIRNYYDLRNNGKKYVAFPVSEAELRNHFHDANFHDDIDIYAGLYQELCERYICYLKVKNPKDSYVIDTYNNKIIKLKLNQSLFEQLEKKENCEKIEEVTSNDNAEGYDFGNVMDTNSIFNRITDKVVGQDEAARMLIYTIYRNLRYSQNERMKSNILLYGPTGCGKTALLKAISQEFGVPFMRENMKDYTAVGYEGSNVKNILKRLYKKCNGNLALAEHAIIMLDEFDKLATTIPRETVNKTDVQDELLTMADGDKINIGDDRNGGEIFIDTSNITFIFCGAFMGLTDPIKKNSMGFITSSDNHNDASDIDVSAFEKYGIKKELLGRLPVPIPVRKLEVSDLERILDKSSISDLKIYENSLYDVDKVKIVYTNRNQFIKDLAHKASEKNTGVRGLKSVVDYVFMEACNKIGIELLNDMQNGNMPSERELIVSSATIDDNSKFVLRKVQEKGSLSVNELSRRARQNN